MKRILALILTLMMVFSMLPVSSFAARPEKIRHHQIEPWVNPLYEGILDVADLEIPEAPASAAMPTAQADYVTEDEAPAVLRAAMKARMGSIPVYIKSQNTDYEALFHTVMDQAMAHTGVPDEGDFLRFQFGGGGGSVSYSFDGTWYYYRFTYAVTYYTTAEQEAELDAAVDSLLAALDLWDATDYEKVCGVYDYICANITYDYDNLKDSSYMLKYTAYGALVNKTAVCQGYAVLLYRLLLELGVDSRVVTGIGNGGGHAWNIVKLGGRYYNADSTWDATWHQAGLPYNFFLRNEENFTEGGTDHIRDENFDTDDFHADYPMGPADYDPTAVIGDLNEDGSVDSNDLTALARHVGGIELVADLLLVNADVNGDGTVDSEDLTMHARYVGGIITDWTDS